MKLHLVALIYGIVHQLDETDKSSLFWQHRIGEDHVVSVTFEPSLGSCSATGLSMTPGTVMRALSSLSSNGEKKYNALLRIIEQN